MYIASAVSAGKPFSEAVREAVEKGYAEPDPRDDLSGQDAARKALILARMIGYRGPAPKPHNLVPKALKSLPLAEFMKRLPEADAEWAAKTAREAARGHVLRYVVSATPRRVSAKLMAVPKTSPIGALTGTRNLVAVHDAPLSPRAAGRQRTRRRRRSDRGGHAQRHLLAALNHGHPPAHPDESRLRRRTRDAARRSPAAIRPPRARGPAQARRPAAGLQLQAARRVQPHLASHRRRTGARRHLGQRRQPRAGRRVSPRGTSA